MKNEKSGKEYILAMIRQVRRRMNTQTLLKRMLEGLCIGLVFAVLFEVYSVFRPFYYAHAFALAAAGVGLIAGIMVGSLTAKDMKSAAAKIDSFGLEERIITAYEEIEKEDSGEDDAEESTSSLKKIRKEKQSAEKKSIEKASGKEKDGADEKLSAEAADKDNVDMDHFDIDDDEEEEKAPV